MNNFVVAYLSMHVGEIEMEEVSAKDELDALLTFLDADRDVFDTLEKLYQYCADTDSYIGVYKL